MRASTLPPPRHSWSRWQSSKRIQKHERGEGSTGCWSPFFCPAPVIGSENEREAVPDPGEIDGQSRGPHLLSEIRKDFLRGSGPPLRVPPGRDQIRTMGDLA
jgi:hypothetical protein